MNEMLAEDHITVKTYVRREGSYSMISPLASVLNTNEAWWISSLSKFKCILIGRQQLVS